MARETTISWKTACGWTGRRAFRLATYPLDLSIFIVRVLVDWLRRGRIRDRASRRAALRQILQAGAEPLPAIVLLGLVVGFSFAMPLVLLAPQLSEAALGPLLMQLIGLELGSLLTAVVLIGHTGRAMAIELANMELHGEARGLERLGIDLDDFFAAPQIVATAMAQLVLATYFITAALFCGMPLASLLFRGEAIGLATATLAAVEPVELLIFIAKNLVYGLIIAGAACHSALRATTVPTDVPERAQQAATSSLLLIFAINGLLAVLAA